MCHRNETRMDIMMQNIVSNFGKAQLFRSSQRSVLHPERDEIDCSGGPRSASPARRSPKRMTAGSPVILAKTALIVLGCALSRLRLADRGYSRNRDSCATTSTKRGK